MTHPPILPRTKATPKKTKGEEYRMVWKSEVLFWGPTNEYLVVEEVKT